MQTSSSAKRTCSECSSASEYTATVLMPSSRHAQMMRRAISPRFAISILLNMKSALLVRLDREQTVAVLHGLTVFDVDRGDFAVGVALNLVHQLHGFDNAQHLPALDHGPDFG